MTLGNNHSILTFTILQSSMSKIIPILFFIMGIYTQKTGRKLYQHINGGIITYSYFLLYCSVTLDVFLIVTGLLI